VWTQHSKQQVAMESKVRKGVHSLPDSTHTVAVSAAGSNPKPEAAAALLLRAAVSSVSGDRSARASLSTAAPVLLGTARLAAEGLPVDAAPRWLLDAVAAARLLPALAVLDRPSTGSFSVLAFSSPLPLSSPEEDKSLLGVGEKVDARAVARPVPDFKGAVTVFNADRARSVAEDADAPGAENALAVEPFGAPLLAPAPLVDKQNRLKFLARSALTNAEVITAPWQEQLHFPTSVSPRSFARFLPGPRPAAALPLCRRC
jgi:hypothetical protein